VRLILFAALVRAWGRGRGLVLPCKAAYLLEVVQISVQMKPKVNGEINVESSVKGRRGSCPSPFSRELVYIKSGVRACDTNLSRDMKEDVGEFR